jgi:hypothetical protein
MHTAVALMSAVVAGLLIWLAIRIVDTSTLGIAGPIGLVVVAVLLLMLAAVQFAKGPITTGSGSEWLSDPGARR